MKLDFEFTKTVFVHEILNPPNPRTGSEVNLKIIDPIELNLRKIEGENNLRRPPRVVDDLKILNPLSIGFTTSEQSKFVEEFNSILLAMNLSLCRSCIVDADILFNLPRIQFKSMNLKSEVRTIGNRSHVYSKDVIGVSDESFGWTSASESINEKRVLTLFRIIQRFKEIYSKQNLSYLNLRKSITEYEKSMKENSRLFIFKHLFNSLELCTNFYKEYTSSAFDEIVSNNMAIPTATVREWRNFYSRIKHV